MSPPEVKEKIQTAYSRAIAQANMSTCPDSSLLLRLREPKLYGREAGMDFVKTHFDLFFKAAINAAECKHTSLTFPFYGFGLEAVEGVAASLRESTSLEVETKQPTVTLIWAKPNSGLV